MNRTLAHRLTWLEQQAHARARLTWLEQQAHARAMFCILNSGPWSQRYVCDDAWTRPEIRQNLPPLHEQALYLTLTLEITGPRKRAKPAVAGPVHRRVGRHLPTRTATYLACSCRFFRPS
jgi:hypothetical protein